MASNNSKDHHGGERERAGKTAARVPREMRKAEAEGEGEGKHAIVTDNHNNRTLHSGALNDFQYVRRRIVSREKRPASSMTHNGKLNAEKWNRKVRKTCMRVSIRLRCTRQVGQDGRALLPLMTSGSSPLSLR